LLEDRLTEKTAPPSTRLELRRPWRTAQSQCVRRSRAVISIPKVWGLVPGREQ
jgi:hypothetical protein